MSLQLFFLSYMNITSLWLLKFACQKSHVKKVTALAIDVRGRREYQFIAYEHSTSHSSHLKPQNSVEPEVASFGRFDIIIDLEHPQISLVQVIWDEATTNT